MIRLRKLATNEAALLFGTSAKPTGPFDNQFDVNLFNYDDIDATVRAGEAGNRWELIGSGASKDVYALNDDYVLKVDGKRGNFGNQIKREVNVWLKADDDDKRHLCPIIAYAKDKTWSIMRRAQRRHEIVDALTEPWYVLYNKLESIVIGELNDRLGIDDFGERNVGVFNNQMVLTDYGY